MSPRWLCCLLALLACRKAVDQTGVVAEISSELTVPDQIDRLRLVVTGVDSGARHADDFALAGAGAQHLPASVLVVPAGGGGGRVRIEATGLKGDQPVVTRSASLEFSAGQILHVALPLRKICAGKTCPAATTCDDQGACDSDGVAGHAPGDDGGPGDAGDRDAGSSDAAPVVADAPVRDVVPVESPPEAGARDLSAPPKDTAVPPPDVAPVDPGTSRCPPGAILCDGFERPMFNENNPWSPFADPGVPSDAAKYLMIDTTKPRRGVASLRVHFPKGAAQVAGFHWTFGAHDQMFVRYFVFLPAAPLGHVAVTFDGFTDQTDTEWSAQQVDLDSTPPDILPNAGALVNFGLPTGRWVCVISGIDLVANQAWIDVDDKRSVTGTFARAPRTSRVQFRFESDLTSSAQDFDMWIDEIAVADHPITCAD